MDLISGILAVNKRKFIMKIFNKILKRCKCGEHPILEVNFNLLSCCESVSVYCQDNKYYSPRMNNEHHGPFMCYYIRKSVDITILEMVNWWNDNA